MMKGYLDTGLENSTVVTVANLPASSTGYDVYVYADGNNGGGVRNGGYQISGAGITTSTLNLTDIGGADFSGTFANGGPGNYVKFTINASGFTLTATPGSSSDSARRAPVNGIQIVPATSSIPDFTVGVNPGTQTVAPGGTGTYSATVGSLNGFNGTVTLSASGAPSGATANFTSASVPGGSGQFRGCRS